MKKVGLSILILLLSHQLYGQEGIHISLEGQPQLTWILNNQALTDTTFQYSYKFTGGWATGASIGYNWADPFGFRIGFYYSKQGQRHEETDANQNPLPIYRELNYFKVPITLHIDSDPGRFMINADLGAQISILHTANISSRGEPLAPVFPFKDAYFPGGLEVTWAIGIKVRLAKWLYATLRHRGDWGLSDIEQKYYFVNGNPVAPFYAASRKKTVNCTFGITGGLELFWPTSRAGRDRGGLWFR